MVKIFLKSILVSKGFRIPPEALPEPLYLPYYSLRSQTEEMGVSVTNIFLLKNFATPTPLPSQSPSFESPLFSKNILINASHLFLIFTEEMGFEPMRGFNTPNPLARGRLRPLSHSSNRLRLPQKSSIF